jgi:hypothetical protein
MELMSLDQSRLGDLQLELRDKSQEEIDLFDKLLNKTLTISKVKLKIVKDNEQIKGFAIVFHCD